MRARECFGRRFGSVAVPDRAIVAVVLVPLLLEQLLGEVSHIVVADDGRVMLSGSLHVRLPDLSGLNFIERWVVQRHMDA